MTLLTIKCVAFPKWQNKNTKDTQYSSKDISSSELLIANLVSAYRRWRLHNGTFQSHYEQSGREELVKYIYPWWHSWAQFWTVQIHGDGFCGLYSGIRTSKGSISDETTEAIKAAILEKDADKGLTNMIVTRYDDKVTEHCGSIWESTGSLHHATVADIVNWVLDCENTEDETSYAEPSGFIYHLSKSVKKRPGVPTPSFIQNLASNSAQTMSHVAKESMHQLTNLMHISTFGYFGGTKTSPPLEPVADAGPSDDLGDSRFLVGLEGGLEDDEVERQPEVYTTDTDLYTEMLPPEESESSKVNLSYKKLYIEFQTTEDQPDTHIAQLEQCSVVIYRRRPFVFCLLYKPKSASLSNKSYYQSLHRRLASLSEPIYTDLTNETHDHQLTETSNSKNRRKSYTTASKSNEEFYYYAYNPTLHKIQYSLPAIPSLESILEIEQYAHDDGTLAQKADFERTELIHVHLQMIHMAVHCRHKGDKEKFIRTTRGWWVYWSKLSDGREILFARKWTRPGKPPMEAPNGLLGALGKDAKVWLDEYKYFGRV